MIMLVFKNSVSPKTFFPIFQDSMPLRLKGSHHINLPSGVEKVFVLVQGFLNEKAKKRVSIYLTGFKANYFTIC